MFKRKVYDKLLEWKKENGRCAVLLQGPRFVGKRTIAEEFAQDNYDSYIKVDFSNITKELLDVFDDLPYEDIFFLRLQSVTSIDLYERRSLIIFENVQYFPKARQAIKHLVADGRYDYIETGCFVNIRKNVKDILIPSEEIHIDVYPLDYEEFCWACGINYDVLELSYNYDGSLGEYINKKLLRDFRIYMAVGGMPQAVEAYVSKKSLNQIDEIKRDILQTYRDEFNRLDPSDRMTMIFDSIPKQLMRQNKRFSLSKVVGRSPTKKDLRLLHELIDSRTVLVSHNVNENSFGFNLVSSFNGYKLYMADIGLLITMIKNDDGLSMGNIYNLILEKRYLKSDLSFLYENMMAQIIKSDDRKLFYYRWYKKGKNHPCEVNFLITCFNKLVVIDVRSTNKSNHVSINEFSKRFSKKISRMILFSQSEVAFDGKLEMKPMYLALMFLNKLYNSCENFHKEP